MNSEFAFPAVRSTCLERSSERSPESANVSSVFTQALTRPHRNAVRDAVSSPLPHRWIPTIPVKYSLGIDGQ